MTERILCVDDDRNLLEGFQRTLGRKFDLSTALGAAVGLEAVKSQAPFAVVISDFRMPDMNGVEFLARVKALSPDSTRILLTGNADLQTAMQAINQGEIYRFLQKPCASEVLSASIRSGIEQYRLVTAEKVLLEQTLSGSIKVLCEILSLVNPEAFGRSSRIVRYVEAMAVRLGIDHPWHVKTAAMLSQIGCVILPEALLKKVYNGVPLSSQESQLYNQHPYVAADLLAKIPRMEHVAQIIALQDQTFDEGQAPGYKSTPSLESRLLKVALDFDALESSGLSKPGAFNRMNQRKDYYDPAVLEALKLAFADEIKYELKSVVVRELTCGMILAEDLKSRTNLLLATRGLEVTQSLIARLELFKEAGGVREPFRVLEPLSNLGDTHEGAHNPKPTARAA